MGSREPRRRRRRDGAADRDERVRRRVWVVSARDDENPLDANQVFATLLANNAVTKGGRASRQPRSNAASPDVAAGTAGLFSNIIAWQQTPGTSGPPEIRTRFTPARSGIGPETVLSSPTQGPTDAGDGLAVGGDVNGDALVAWVQGAPGARAIVAAQLYQPPGGFHAAASFAYARNGHPLLSWSAVQDPWRLTYQVVVDGVAVAQTGDWTSIRDSRRGRRRPAPLAGRRGQRRCP